jgi:hypothetical protein
MERACWKLSQQLASEGQISARQAAPQENGFRSEFAFGVRSEGFPMNPTREKSDRVEIRIKNGSNVDFDRVLVHFPDQREVDYGPVPKGGVTAFQATSRAYRYAGFSVKAGGQELSLQPIDYMGEQELSAGRYTYSLGVDNGHLTVQLEKVN